MNNKKNKKTLEFIFFKCLIWIIIGLIVLMLIIVVRDRCVFHNQVYDIAFSEINERETPCADSVIYDSLNNRKLYADTITKTQKTNASSSDVRNFNEISQSVTINNSNPINHIKEDAFSLIDKLKDIDGLISANGITYLISLIVALLIALVSDRVIAMEQLISEVSILKAEIRETMQLQIQQLDDKIKEKILQELKTSTTLFYYHTTNYNNILTRIESLYNHTMLIDNTISSIEVNEKTTEAIGLLGSRINLICDEIIDRFNNSKLKLNFITSDEKRLLETYVDDTLLCLQEDLKEVNKKGNDALSTIIQDKIYLVEGIRDIIGTIESREEIYT